MQTPIEPVPLDMFALLVNEKVPSMPGYARPSGRSPDSSDSCLFFCVWYRSSARTHAYQSAECRCRRDRPAYGQDARRPSACLPRDDSAVGRRWRLHASDRCQAIYPGPTRSSNVDGSVPLSTTRIRGSSEPRTSSRFGGRRAKPSCCRAHAEWPHESSMRRTKLAPACRCGPKRRHAS